jgi:hypothetical protein
MRTATHVALAFALLLAPTLSLAQVVPADLPPLRVSVRRVARPRIRVGCGFHGGGILAPSLPNGAGNSVGAAGPGGYVRVGVQFTDVFGAELDTSFATLLFLNYARAAALATITPRSPVTIAFGPMIGAIYTYGPNLATVFGGSLRLDGSAVMGRAPRGGRHGFSMGVAVDLGVAVGMDGGEVRGAVSPALGAYAYLGYAVF